MALIFHVVAVCDKCKKAIVLEDTQDAGFYSDYYYSVPDGWALDDGKEVWESFLHCEECKEK